MFDPVLWVAEHEPQVTVKPVEPWIRRIPARGT